MRRPTPMTLTAALLLSAGNHGALDAQTHPQADDYPAARHGGGYMHNFYIPPAPSSSPWAPEWSADGSRIAVSMAGSIWSVDPESGMAEELTAGAAYHSAPTWSPDGRWLVYSADDDGARIGLEALNVETGVARRLTTGDHIYLDATFSPDGSRLAYVSTEPSGYFNVYVRAFRDGAWAGPPVAVTMDHAYPSNRLYFGPQDMHITPAWLPGGDELLLVSNRDVPLGSGNVLRVPAEAAGIERATTVLAEQTLYRTRPDVSLDGKRFIYSSTAGSADQFNNLYVQPTVGGEPYKLTFYMHDAFHPRWSPDGEWIAYVSNEGGVPRLELLETYGGARRVVEITARKWRRPTGRVRARVVTAESGAPIPARILLTASDGRAYAPPNTYGRVGGTGLHFFHTPGSFEVEVPIGRVTLTAVHGFETLPRTVTLDVAEGAVAETTLRLETLWDLDAEGCYSGSTHTHMNYAGNLHNTLENMILMSRAEDQDVLNEQIANKDNRVLDHQFFVPGGGAHPLSTPGHVVVVGQEYRPPFYGHVFMLGLRDHLISPFLTGYEGTAVESLYPSNTDMLRKAKAQGATVGYVHPFSGAGDPLEGNLGGGKGFMVDVALGTVDVLEWSTPGTAGFFPLYAAWNNGRRVSASGGEDSITNLHRWRVLGALRSYVCTESGDLDMDGWMRGLRQGRGYVTSGPLLEVRVEDARPGESIDLPDGVALPVRARVRSIVPLRRLEVVQDGEVVHTAAFTGDRTAMDLSVDVAVEGSGWIHVRVFGDASESFPLDAGTPLAFSNPVWVFVGGAPIRSVRAAEYGIRWVDALREMAEEWPGWRSEAERAHVFAQFDEARAVYEQLGREAAGR